MPSSQEIQLAVNRIMRAMAGQRKPGYRDIRLGLDRMQKLVKPTQSWKGVHVGGTNGKGSICYFLGGFFKLAGVGYGSYTSPGFPEKQNGVLINGLYVHPVAYESVRNTVQSIWNRISTRWSLQHAEEPETLPPFELDTATAFQLFEDYHVPYGIVEVGMGGATDATNVMREKAVTVISKIGLDHQEYLGNTIENIAKVKAGIMEKNVPCIVDHTNQPSVIKVLREHAREVGAHFILTWKAEPLLMTLDNEKWKLNSFEIQNLLCAAMAFRHLFPHKEINLNKVLELKPFPVGRLQRAFYTSEADGIHRRELLADGAHNMLGIEALVGHVDSHLRQDQKPVTWIMGISSSKYKPFDQMIEKCVRPHDNVAFVEFEQQEENPPPAPANFGVDHAKTFVKDESQVYEGPPKLKDALVWACQKAGDDNPIVLAGSLYLVRDLLKLEGIFRRNLIKTRRPGRSQLARYVDLSKERELTPEEEREFKQARRHWYTSPIRPHISKFRPKGESDTSPKALKKSEIQKKAAFHQNQRLGYQATLKTIQREMEEKSGDDSSPSMMQELAQKTEELKQEMHKHQEQHHKLMFELRGYIPEKRFKHWGTKRIFGAKKGLKKNTPSPFLQAQAEAIESPVVARKEIQPWEQTVEEAAAAAAAESARNLKRKLADERMAEDKRNKAKKKHPKEEDVFTQKLGAGRRGM